MLFANGTDPGLSSDYSTSARVQNAAEGPQYVFAVCQSTDILTL